MSVYVALPGVVDAGDADLDKWCEKAGLQKVQTTIASGKRVFDSRNPLRHPADMAAAR